MFFLQAFLFYTVSLDIHQFQMQKKRSHMPSPPWLGMWQSSSCSGMRNRFQDLIYMTLAFSVSC